VERSEGGRKVSRFTVIDCEQRTPIWYAARAGKATASRAGDMLAKIKAGEAAGRRNYRTQLVAERLTGLPQEQSYVSKYMERGAELEDTAIPAYEAFTGNLVKRSGFIALNAIEAGCSLDGHLGDFETLVGVKCPLPATHVSYWRAARLPPEYVPQVTHELWVTGARKYHFLSYNESFPEELQLFLIECDRSEFDVEQHEKETLQFLAEVEAEVKMLRNAKNPWAMYAAVASAQG
jgi:hypothetical protein